MSERGARRAHEGYAYIFPKRDHVNVGVGYVLAHYRESIGTPPYALQQGFVDRLCRDGIVEGASVRSNFTPFLIPVGGPLRRPARGRVLVAGDAGGFALPFSSPLTASTASSRAAWVSTTDGRLAPWRST